MSRNTVSSAHERIDTLEPRVTRVETQVDERWRETIIRIKRIETIMISIAGAIVIMLASILIKMG
jgi:hypothetical protein